VTIEPKLLTLAELTEAAREVIHSTDTGVLGPAITKIEGHLAAWDGMTGMGRIMHSDEQETP
jgi:hypothetical protein